MSNILTSWRQALVTHLAANLSGGSFEVIAGERDGAADRDLACVFVPAWQEDRNIAWARPPMIVRAWTPKPAAQLTVARAVDPEPLEQLTVDLLETLQPVQQTLLDGIYFHVAKVRLDYDDWGVEATLSSYTANLAVVT